MATTFTSMIDLVYPVNSIYLSWSSSFSPATSFGGTWSRLTAGKMLRTGTGNATGGNDAHSHAYGALTASFYGSMVNYNDSNVSFVLANPGVVNDSTTSTDVDIFSDTIQGTNNNRWGVMNTALQTSQKGQNGFIAIRMLANTGKNLRYGNIKNTISGGTSITTDAQVLTYGKNLEAQTPVIPAYQTINTWYRTA